MQFRKLDLHVHTPASRCFHDGQVSAADVVDRATAQGLAAIAITDHNTGAWIDDVKNSAAKKDLTIFPGVEITCMCGKGGVHIIAIFDPSCGTRHIESLLGELGLQPDQFGNEETVVKKDPISVVQIIQHRGGLAVLAHANSTKGCLHDMQGQQRTALIQCPELSGAEGTDFRDEDAKTKHRRVVDLLDGSDSTYKRKLGVYQASDNPNGILDGQHGLAGIGGRCSYFKLDRINLEGLRQCLADPDVRIRQDFEFTTFVYPRIVSAKVKGGFLDGAESVFHEGLNSVLGAKGAGKSLLVEFLRFALNQPPSNPDILADHKTKLQGRLGNYGSVEVTLADETGRPFTVKRMFSPAEDHPYSGGERYDMAQLFPVLFLSQNEIIKIAESEAEQITFIDRFFDFHTYQQEIADIEVELGQLDGQLGEAFRAYKDVRQLDQSRATAAKDIEQLDTALKNPVFDDFNRLEMKDRALREQAGFIKLLTDQLANCRKDVSGLTAPGISVVYAEDPVLRRLADINRQAKDAAVASLDEASTEVAKFKAQTNAEYATWLPQFQAAKRTYDETVQKEGGDYRNLAQKRAKRVKELEVLDQRLGVLRQKTDRIKEIDASRKASLARLKEDYERYTKERQTRCARIEAESAGRLLVRIQVSTNVDEFRRRLLALKRGSYLRDAEIEKICSKADSGAFVRAVIRYGVFREGKTLEPLAKVVEIDLDRMRMLAEFLSNEFRYEDILALEYKALPQDRPEIRYNVGQNTFEPLNRLSVGQKCTAMLIIALSEGSVPIIIDQPEDSLDIRTIWDDMCCKIRRGKDQRQFIFTTHNSSLAVASDTDKFLIMEATATQGQVLFSGSMDHAPVSDQVIKYLEGGMDTYRTKYGKYQIEGKH